MAYNRVIISGSLPGAEVWSCGLSFGPGAGDPVDDTAGLQLWADNIGATMQTWITTNTLRQFASTAVTFTQVRCELREEDESLVLFAEHVLAPVVIGISTPSKPFQTSLVLSLRTLTPGGRGRGRVYWPTLALVLSTTDLRVSSGSRTSYLTDWANFIGDIITDAPIIYVGELVVRSVTFHTNAIVTNLQCGDVADVQRRRRDNLVENYSIQTI